MFSFNFITAQTQDNFFYGQDKNSIIDIKARVLEDSREIGGGKSIFRIDVFSARGIDSTITNASGKLVIASTINVYKGQVISINKKNIFSQEGSLVFIDRKYISVLKWENGITGKILRVRAKILDRIKLNIRRMPPKISILFSALFTGIKENPKGEIFISLRKAGASHILALSGMHLGILSFILMLVLTLIIGKKQSFIITFIILLLYTFLVSSGPSLIRALFLFFLLGVFGIYGFKTDIFHILVICFFIQVTIYPQSAYSISFQLSYLALGGIILCSKTIDQLFPGFIPAGLRGVLSASISAQIFTAALVLHNFGVMYPVGIISGIILVPIITVFIWTGLVALFPVPWIIQVLLFKILDGLYSAVEKSASFFSQFPSFGVRSAVTGFLVICLLAAVSRYYKILFIKRPLKEP